MSKKQALYVRFIVLFAAICVSIIFLWKALDIKTDESVVWIQWIFAFALIWLLILNYLSYIALGIKYIYKDYFKVSEKALDELKIKLIIYLIINFILQSSLLMFLLFANFEPKNIGLRDSHKINKTVFIVFTVFTSLSIIITPLQGWRKYRFKKNKIETKRK